LGLSHNEKAQKREAEFEAKQIEMAQQRRQYLASLAMLTPAQEKEVRVDLGKAAEETFERIVGFIPLIGPLVEGIKAADNEDYVGAIFFFALAAFDGVTLAPGALRFALASTQQVSKFSSAARTLPQIGTRGNMSRQAFNDAVGTYRNAARVPVVRYGEQSASIRAVRGQNCFAAGTPVLTPDGQKPIEELRPGDLVLSRSEHDLHAPPEPRLVRDTFVRVAPVIVLQIDGVTIRTTAEHPFYVKGKGWQCAKELQVGDRLATSDGQWATVEQIGDAGQVVTVYNLSVEDYHTYFVGHEAWGFAIWVHNADYFIQPTGSGRYGLHPEGGGVVYEQLANGTRQQVPTFANVSELARYLENKTLVVGPNARTIPAAGQRGIWDIASDLERGAAAEARLGGRTGLHFDFPTIDRFENGVATSVKTMNLGLPSYQNTQQIISTGERYIDQVAAFRGGQRVGVVIENSQITQRALDLVVPPWTTSAQREALQRLGEYGSRQNPHVLVRILELQ
jgi:hypothetical protein